MIIETLRLFKAGLENGTYGINAQIAALDVFAGDSVPPNIATIEDETQDGPAVALNRPPRPFPGISVTQEGDAVLDPFVPTVNREGSVTIALRYYAENSQTQNITRDGMYTMRALVSFLHDFFLPTNDADRSDNSIQLCYVTGLSQSDIISFEEDTIIIGQLTVTIQVRDIAP